MADKFYAGQTDYILELNDLDTGVTGSASSAEASAIAAEASAVAAAISETNASAYENYQGNWSSLTTYDLGDSVGHDDTFWISNTNTNLNSEPTAVNTDWSDIGANSTIEAQQAATEAEASAAAALVSENNADTSESNALTYSGNASTSADQASTSESNASTSETNAGISESNASDSETASSISAGNASTSEGNALASASSASTSASNASTSEANSLISSNNSSSFADDSEDYSLEAKDWSDRPEDTITRTFTDGVGYDRTSGNYSALHYSAKSESSASDSSASAAAALVSETNAASYSNYTGAWNSGSTYLIGESVSNDDKLWLCVVGNSNSEPTDVNTNWFFLSTQIDSGNLKYIGEWNASTNTPTIPTASTNNNGDYYIVSSSGNTDIGGITDWEVDDWVVSIGTSWIKNDNSDKVESVAGKSGAVTLDTDDISEGSNKYYTEAKVDANTNVASNTLYRHNHSNSTVLDNTTASYTITQSDKLGLIEENATADQTSGEIEAVVSHDNLQAIDADQHIDWVLSNAKNINPDNYTSDAKNLLGNGDNSLTSRGDYDTAPVALTTGLVFYLDHVISVCGGTAVGQIQRLAYNSSVLCQPVRYEVTTSGTGNIYARRQLIDIMPSIVGKTVTFTVEIKTNMDDVSLQYYGLTAHDDDTTTGDETWRTVSFTQTIEDSTYCNFNVGVTDAASTLTIGDYFEIGRQKVEVSESFTDFETITEYDQKLRCGAIDDTNATGTGSKSGSAGDFHVNGFVNTRSDGVNGDGIMFEDGLHSLSANDDKGNFNLRVGNKVDRTGTSVEVCSEAGKPNHLEWSTSTGEIQFNQCDTTLAVDDEITWTKTLSLMPSGDVTVLNDLSVGGDIDGANVSDTAGNSTIVKRTSSGYIRANYYNTTAADTSTTPSHVYVETGSDGYIRPQTWATFSDKIADYGSNSNGHYQKFSNGVMIVWGYKIINVSNSVTNGFGSTAGTGMYYANGTITFPVAFYATPFVLDGGGGNRSGGILDAETYTSTTGCTARMWHYAVKSNARIVFMAIGRWTA